MAANDYKPVSWNGEPITNLKLNQMANNTQYLFERAPRIRYSGAGLTRDTALKIISGKSPFPIKTNMDWVDTNIYFGSFFSAGCKPVVVATVETTGGWLRKYVSLRGFGGEIDHTGFIAHVVTHESFADHINSVGWVHWTATGY